MSRPPPGSLHPIPPLIFIDQWLDVYDVLDTRLEHVQRGSVIPDGERHHQTYALD